MLIPIGTDIRLRRAPVANWVLIGLNVLVFVLTNGLELPLAEHALPPLDAAVPAIHQYLTYQFRHGDIMHLLGNMLFLWIFGNAVCDRMGSLSYAVFYLAAGIFAGVMFAANNSSALVGASGAIAAVTTAFLVFYPRVHITLLLWFFVVTTIQMPAMLLIVVKIILWDNIVAPNVAGRGAAFSSVAYSAHLAGYGFGFVTAVLMLALRALPRNQFDLLALWNRWRRRAGITTDLAAATARARPVIAEELSSRPLEPAPLAPHEKLREEIVDRLSEHDAAEAVRLYDKLLELDPRQVLPRQPQLEIANALAQSQRHADAVRAYEGFLATYPFAPDGPQVRLLVGMICNRYLGAFDKAIEHLRAALGGLGLDSQRRLAEQELRYAETQLGPA